MEKAAEMFEKAGDVGPESYEALILAADPYLTAIRSDPRYQALAEGLPES